MDKSKRHSHRGQGVCGKLKGDKAEVWQEKSKRMAGRKSLIIIKKLWRTKIRYLVNSTHQIKRKAFRQFLEIIIMIMIKSCTN